MARNPPACPAEKRSLGENIVNDRRIPNPAQVRTAAHGDRNVTPFHCFEISPGNFASEPNVCSHCYSVPYMKIPANNQVILIIDFGGISGEIVLRWIPQDFILIINQHRLRWWFVAWQHQTNIVPVLCCHVARVSWWRLHAMPYWWCWCPALILQGCKQAIMLLAFKIHRFLSALTVDFNYLLLFNVKEPLMLQGPKGHQ